MAAANQIPVRGVPLIERSEVAKRYGGPKEIRGMPTAAGRLRKRWERQLIGAEIAEELRTKRGKTRMSTAEKVCVLRAYSVLSRSQDMEEFNRAEQLREKYGVWLKNASKNCHDLLIGKHPLLSRI